MSKRWVIGLFIPFLLWAQVDHFEVNLLDTPPYTAGVNFTVEIKAVDAGGNVVSGYDKSVFLTVKGKSEYINPSTVSLENGTATINVYVTLAEPNLTIECFNVDGSGVSDAFEVKPGSFNKLLLLLPGETHTPGISPGKKGTATATAGDKVNATVYLTDAWWNVVNTGSAKVSFSSSDPFAILPEETQVDIQKTFEIELRTVDWGEDKTARTVTISSAEIQNSSSVEVSVGDFTGLLMLIPEIGENPVPGDTQSYEKYPGKTTEGEEILVQQGKQYEVKIYGVDKCWNWVKTASGEVTLDIEGGEVDVNIPPMRDGVSTGSITFKDEVGYRVTPKMAGILQRYPTLFDVTSGLTSITINTKDGKKEGLVNVPIYLVISIEPKRSDIDIRLKIIEGEEAELSDTLVRTLSGVVPVNPTFTAKKPGIYKIEAKPLAFDITDTLTLTIKEIQKVIIWPNPVIRKIYSGPVKINYPVRAELGSNRVILYILDPFGNLVKKESYTDPEHNKSGINTITWDGNIKNDIKAASGIYQIVVRIERRDGIIDVFKNKVMIIR